jgi:uncharacterized protein
MTGDKPSKNEDEYFARRDAEILKAGREAAAKAEKDAERRSHFMRCPKCGGQLKTESQQGVEVDRCPDCLGVWFDAGEAESLLRAEPGGVGRILGALLRGVSGREKGSKRA